MMCQIGRLNQLSVCAETRRRACLCAIGVGSSRQLANGWCFGESECVALPTFNRFVLMEVVRVSAFVSDCLNTVSVSE
jgi:hypothetical protein